VKLRQVKFVITQPQRMATMYLAGVPISFALQRAPSVRVGHKKPPPLVRVSLD